MGNKEEKKKYSSIPKKNFFFGIDIFFTLCYNERMNGIKIGKYRHFKGGEYEVLTLAKHSETGEETVVYRALYGDGQVWVRPAVMWREEVEREGKTFPRFTYIGE